MEKGITVLICTYNGGLKLTKTLEHLAGQIISKDIKWEIILVDNASTDDTMAIALEEWKKYNVDIPLSIVQENTPGKLYAFQKGISLTKFEYFIICDDDNWLNPNYVNIAFDILESNPKIGAVGGETIAVTVDGGLFPDWFETYKEGYAVGKQTENTGDITWRGHLWGAGLASRTQLYIETYKTLPSLLLSDTDKKILSTEDTEYCLRIILKGYQLYYDSRLSLKHFIPSERLTLNYKNGLFENFKNSHVILEKYYLAIKFGMKGKLNLFNRIRLLFITPFRLLFASSETKKAKQKTILSYVLPGLVKSDSITAQVKSFILNN